VVTRNGDKLTIKLSLDIDNLAEIRIAFLRNTDK